MEAGRKVVYSATFSAFMDFYSTGKVYYNHMCTWPAGSDGTCSEGVDVLRLETTVHVGKAVEITRA